jgi:hypothetical protein
MAFGGICGLGWHCNCLSSSTHVYSASFPASSGLRERAGTAPLAFQRAFIYFSFENRDNVEKAAA